MAADFIRPTPRQMLIDTQIQAIERGKAYNENDAIDYVNTEFRVNRWKHGDIPLPHVDSPIIFEASDERRAAIKADDAEAKREVAELRAQADRERYDRDSVEAIRNADKRRMEMENDDLRHRVAELEAREAGGKPVTPIPAGITPGETQPDGTIPSLGRPDASSNMAEIQEWMIEHSVPSPTGQFGVSLNTLGRKRLLEHIDSIMAGREAPAQA